jgi:hypothetical protein
MEERTRANHQSHETPPKQRGIPTVSRALDDGTLVELLYDARERKTSLAVWQKDTWSVESSFALDPKTILAPYSLENNLIKHQVILFPEKPEEYGTKQELVKHIQTFIHRYVDLSLAFEIIATYYILLSWVYGAFNELPYLRVRGDYGSGKTRFLLVVGSLCYKELLQVVHHRCLPSSTFSIASVAPLSWMKVTFDSLMRRQRSSRY